MGNQQQEPGLVWSVPDILSWKALGVTLGEWRRYLGHDHANPSRGVMYDILDTYLARVGRPQSFVEVGFGSCIDFMDHLRYLHDEGQIVYVGFDITEHFVGYARAEYPGYDFRLGGFRDLGEVYDISFTRHTLQHLNPGLLESSLRALLRAARALTIITWRMTPGREHIVWKPRSKEMPEGNWVNAYDKEAILGIIRDEGFHCKTQSCESRETIYILERK